MALHLLLMSLLLLLSLADPPKARTFSGFLDSCGWKDCFQFALFGAIGTVYG